MPSEWRSYRRVEFSDTDAAGIVHFAQYFRYMEFAEHEFLRSLGVSVFDSTPERLVGWARKAVDCEYTRPLVFEDEIEIRLLVRRKSTRTLSYEAEFRRRSKDEGDAYDELVARGTMTVICIEKTRDGSLSAIPIPKHVDTMLEVHVDGS